jgi:hypothetical protein
VAQLVARPPTGTKGRRLESPHRQASIFLEKMTLAWIFIRSFDRRPSMIELYMCFIWVHIISKAEIICLAVFKVCFHVSSSKKVLQLAIL